MPTCTCIGLSVGDSSWPIFAIRSSPACTARSASCSVHSGYPKYARIAALESVAIISPMRVIAPVAEAWKLRTTLLTSSGSQ